jgi:hypothetical protein
MNNSTTWLYRQYLGILPQGSALCYLCGTPCPETHSVAKSIADTFNSHAFAQCPSSPYLCAACQWYLNGKAGHPDFRKMSIIVQRETWRSWERTAMKQDIGCWLEGELDQDAYLVISLTKKKHLLLQAPLNLASSHTLAIQIEERVAYLTRSDWQEMDTAFMTLLGLGHSKGEILSGELHTAMLRKHGDLRTALLTSQQLDVWRGSPQLDLLSYVTLQQEKEDIQSDNDPRTEPGGGRTRVLPARDGDPSTRGSTTQGRVQRHGLGRVGQVSNDDLDNSRDNGSQHGSDVQQLSLFPE